MISPPRIRDSGRSGPKNARRRNGRTVRGQRRATGGQPHERLAVAPARHVGASFAKAFVEGIHRPARQVHGPEHVSNRVCSAEEHPPGGLQLVNLPKPLEPGVVDQFAFGDFALGQARRRGEGDVSVDRVVAQAFALEVSHGKDRVGAAKQKGTEKVSKESPT